MDFGGVAPLILSLWLESLECLSASPAHHLLLYPIRLCTPREPRMAPNFFLRCNWLQAMQILSKKIAEFVGWKKSCTNADYRLLMGM